MLMSKNRFLKLICLFLTVFSVLSVFSSSVPVIALDDASTADESAEEEDIDPMYFKFVGRLYAIVTRQMHADESEKHDLAKSLKGGISAAYDVMYHFYFSDAYRELGQSDEDFVEDLYTGAFL